jgi:hypothetical protein
MRRYEEGPELITNQVLYQLSYTGISLISLAFPALLLRA